MAGRPDQPPAEFACTCGALAGSVAPAALRGGARIECFCRDCRAAQIYLEQPDPAPGAVETFLTTPDAISITRGGEHLSVFRLGPKGVYRWYAGCCKAPLFNTLGSPKLPFAGIATARFDAPDLLGPVIAQNAVPQPDGSTRLKGGLRMAFGVFRRMIAARLGGRWRRTPFFDPDSGAPTVEPTVLTREQRARLYP